MPFLFLELLVFSCILFSLRGIVVVVFFRRTKRKHRFDGEGTLVFPRRGKFVGSWLQGRAMKVQPKKKDMVIRERERERERERMDFALIFACSHHRFYGGTISVQKQKKRMSQGSFFFDDELEYEAKDWKYCSCTGDRRFWSEIQAGAKVEGFDKNKNWDKHSCTKEEIRKACERAAGKGV